MQSIGTIILAILAFGLLIVVHEFGHFITAKRGGVQVNEFCVGMGPQIYAKEYRGTVYALRLFPIGGACVMEGEDEENHNPHAFGNASKPRRALILAAGALMNFLVGFLLVFAILLTSGADTLATTRISVFEDGFAYEGEDMLLPGDQFLSVNGYRVFVASDVSVGLTRGRQEGVHDIKLRRDGKTVWLRDFAFAPAFVSETGQARYGINFATEPASFGGYLKNAGYMSVNFARLVWYSLGDLVRGRVGVDQLSGPVGVAGVMAQTAKSSFSDFLLLVAFISINLGVMNLLPLPALDGGRLLFLLIEAVRRKPVPPKYEGFVHGAGLALLMLLMVYVTGNDILRLLTRG